MILKTSYKMKPPVSARLLKGRAINKGLICCLCMNERCGVKVFDYSGSGNAGIFFDNNCIWTPAKFGYGVEFDGLSDSRIMINPFNGLNTDKFSISVIFNTNTAGEGNNGYLIGFTGGTVFRCENAAGAMRLYIDWTVTNGMWNSAANVTFNEFHHFIITYDGSSTANDPIIFQDGSIFPFNRIIAPAGNYVPVSGQCWIGTNIVSAVREYDGIVDNVMIWNRVLTAGEIHQLTAHPFCIFERPMDPLFALAPAEIQVLYMDLSTQIWTVRHAIGLFTKL